MAGRVIRQRGLINFWTGLILSILVTGVWLGFKVAPIYYRYYEIETLMHAQARGAQVSTVHEIRQNILKRVKELEIPLASEDDLSVSVFGSEIQMHLEWEEVLDIDFGDLFGFYSGDEELYFELHIFEFEIDVRK
jgi:hypothetical protein